jgi:addiction module HigA family antidote
MPMHNPPHPGETLRDDVLPALGLSVTAAAEHLGVTRQRHSQYAPSAAVNCPLALTAPSV